MGVETAADRAIFTNTGDFGTAVTYTPKTGGARSINVIFDNEAVNIDPGSGAMVSTVDPHVMVETEKLVNGGSFGETLLINGSTYSVRSANPDGTGMTRLELKFES